jgi:type I restriction enzyme S subunit
MSKEKKIIPELRFPEFKNEGEWKTDSLGNLVEIKGRIGYRGYTRSDIVEKGKGAITLSPSNFEDSGSLNFKKCTYITWEKYEESPEIMLEEGQTVLVKTASVGKSAYVKELPEKATINPQIVVLKPQKIEPKFLAYSIFHNYVQVQIKGAVGAGAIPNMSQDSISKFDILLPPDKKEIEQQKIASCLSSLDELLAAHNDKLDALKDHKKGLLQNLFPQEGETVPKVRFPEFEDDGEWVESSIQSLLDNNIITSHLDGNHGALYPRAEEFSEDGVPYLTANDFISGSVDFRYCKHLPVERANKFKKGIAKNGDILFAHNATVGPVAKLITDLPFVILSTTATYYRCDNESLINDFLRYALESPFFVAQYTRVMSQSTRNQVPITTQRQFNLLLPKPKEQLKIAACLSAVDELITAQQEKIEELQLHKKGLMQGLFPKIES